jgi:nucleotide-binding universal stress UspA family protein
VKTHDVPSSKALTTQTIVVGVDGSPSSRRALAFACVRAHESHSALVLVHSYLADIRHISPMAVLPLPDPSYFHDIGQSVLDAAIIDAKSIAPDLDITGRLALGGGGPQICEHTTAASIAVVGRSNGSTISHLVLGSVTRYVLDRSRCPVVVVPTGYDEHLDVTTIAAATDGSADADLALDWAYDEAERTGATLRVVHAWSSEPGPRRGGPADRSVAQRDAQAVLDVATDRLTERHGSMHGPVVSMDKVLIEGSTKAAVVAAATDAQLTVVGHRGLGRLGHLLVGSVARHVAEHASCPVVVVPNPT